MTQQGHKQLSVVSSPQDGIQKMQKSGKFYNNLIRRACIVVATCVAARKSRNSIPGKAARSLGGWVAAARKIVHRPLARCCGEDCSSLTRWLLRGRFLVARSTARSIARCCGEDGIRRAEGRRGAAAPLVRQSVSKIKSIGKLNLNYFFEIEK